MSLLKTIKNLPTSTVVAEDIMQVSVTLEFNNKQYTGFAYCHTEDKDFFSKHVGYTIARYRATTELLKDLIKQTREEVKWKYQISQELIETPAFCQVWNNYCKADNRLTRLKYALKKEKQALKFYLEDQDKAVTLIKRFRNMDENK